MTGDVTLQNEVSRVVNELTDPVWEAQSAALAVAAEQFRSLDQKYPFLIPMMTRVFFREYLEAAVLPPGWQISGDTAKLAQTMICGHGVCLRYLKERREHGAPPAGRNLARRVFWQPSLIKQEPLTEPLLTLLLLWDRADSAAEGGGGFVMRVVHTTGTGSWGQKTPLDLSVDLVPGLGLESGLEFPAEAEETDFFAVLDEQELEQGDGA